jgi:hypothetical protein
MDLKGSGDSRFPSLARREEESVLKHADDEQRRERRKAASPEGLIPISHSAEPGAQITQAFIYLPGALAPRENFACL